MLKNIKYIFKSFFEVFFIFIPTIYNIYCILVTLCYSSILSYIQGLQYWSQLIWPYKYCKTLLEIIYFFWLKCFTKKQFALIKE